MFTMNKFATINKLNTVMMVIHAGRVNPKMMIFSIMLLG